MPTVCSGKRNVRLTAIPYLREVTTTIKEKLIVTIPVYSLTSKFYSIFNLKDSWQDNLDRQTSNVTNQSHYCYY